MNLVAVDETRPRPDERELRRERSSSTVGLHACLLEGRLHQIMFFLGTVWSICLSVTSAKMGCPFGRF